MLSILALGGLYFFLSNLSPEYIRARGQQSTAQALAQAREALIGYAVQYREQQRATGTNDAMYGFLPMPDVGTSRMHPTGQPASCRTEGCAMVFINGAFPGNNETVIGRFPWRTLGTGPLKDSNGECLWYAVSANYKNLGMNPSLTMNWDTLSQLDVVVANGTMAMVSAIASAHDRPIAVIFSPGPPLAGQDRSASDTDTVTECGGNYEVKNYLDPAVATDLGVDPNDTTKYVTNYLAGIHSASGDTSATNKSLATGSTVSRHSDGTLWAGPCPPGDTTGCVVVGNDTGTAVTSELLFRTLRGSSYFRTDINAMLDRMTDCLRDQIQAHLDSATNPSVTPEALIGFPPPTDKTVGRIPASACYNDTQNPLGYFSHYRDQVFIASKVASDFTVTDTKNTTATSDDTTTTTCAGALLFASQRGSGQTRTTTAERNAPANYLEGANLTSFITTGALSFTGPTQFTQVFTSPTGGQTVNQDIVRCVPSGASLAVVAPTVAASAGNIQLATYTPGTSVLTLGSAGIVSNYGANAADLFACAWTPEVHDAGTGFRSYFRFRIRRVGEGFTFAVIDGDRNAANACGAARQHLGYSGDSGNVLVPYIQWPKFAIEFDTSRQANFSESGSTLSNGRRDPCYRSSCGGQGLDNDAHVAVVYWGYGAADATIPVTQPLQDDNVHGFPWPPDTSARPAPRNPEPVLPYPTPAPDPAPGVAPLDRMGSTTGAFREFHARLEVTRSFTAPADAKNGSTAIQVKVWIEPHPAANISAMSYNAGSPPTLSVTTSSAHNLATGDTVVIKDAVPPGYNGEYPVTKIDATHFTATLPVGTADPGRYISGITWADNPFGTDLATVSSINHGLSTGNIVTISGAFPPEFNGTRTITRINADSYSFGLELNYEPGDLVPAVAAAKALTPRAIALANTTRPMSELDATAKAFITDNATIYDEQKSACAASAPLCPTGQSCGSDNMCYRPSFRNLRLGFTVAERPTTSLTTARSQLIEIRDRATTWLP